MFNLNTLAPPTIAKKLLFWFLVISLVPVLFIGFLTYKTSEKMIMEETLERLLTIAESKELLFNEYIKEQERALTVLAFSPAAINITEKYYKAFPGKGADPQEYTSLEKEHREFFDGFINEFRFHDLLFIDIDGNVFFTLNKKADLGTNLYKGPYKDTDLAKVYKQTLTSGKTALSGFNYYAPSGHPAIFIGKTVLHENKVIGAAVLQISDKEIYREVGDYSRLGKTGEIVIAHREGNEAVFITPLRHDADAAFKRRLQIGSKEALPIQLAVQGKSGAGLSVDYRGKEILAAWVYMPRLKWGMVLKMDTSEAYQLINDLRYLALGTVITTIIIVSFIAFRISRSISAPIKVLQKGSEIIGSGNLDHTVATDSEDEIGELSRAFDEMTLRLKNSRTMLESEIAERRHAEDQLAISERSYRTLAENIPGIVYRVFLREKSRIRFFSRTSELLTGYKDADLQEGKICSIESLMLEEDRPGIIEKLKQAVADQRTFALEYRIRHRNGDIRHFFEQGIPVMGEDGRPLYIDGIIQDITKLKLAEAELQKEKEKLQKYLDISAVMVVIIDNEQKVTLINKKGCEILGYNEDEIVGKNWFDNFLPEGIREDVRSVFLKLISEEFKPVEYYENSVLTRNGEERTIAWYNTVFRDENNNILGTMSTGADITERNKTEEKLKLLNREMEQIIQVTSHDLRTPLAVVTSYSREMERFIEDISPLIEKEGIPPELKEKVNNVQRDIRDTLKYIKSNIRKMDSLLNGLLKLSRSGRVELHIENIDMNRLMDDVASTVELEVKRAGAKLEISELPPCIGDELQINQAFSNLLGNALKYLDPARPGIINISGHSEHGKSVYCVEDNGIGIAPEHHAKIFEIFHQVDRGSGKGEGLGLTMVRKILDRHNGRIWLESEPGKGSRFFVSLPA